MWASNNGEEEEADEVELVAPANAIVYPGAVVVHEEDAAITSWKLDWLNNDKETLNSGATVAP